MLTAVLAILQKTDIWPDTFWEQVGLVLFLIITSPALLLIGVFNLLTWVFNNLTTVLVIAAAGGGAAVLYVLLRGTAQGLRNHMRSHRTRQVAKQRFYLDAQNMEANLRYIHGMIEAQLGRAEHSLQASGAWLTDDERKSLNQAKGNLEWKFSAFQQAPNELLLGEITEEMDNLDRLMERYQVVATSHERRAEVERKQKLAQETARVQTKLAQLRLEVRKQFPDAWIQDFYRFNTLEEFEHEQKRLERRKRKDPLQWYSEMKSEGKVEGREV
jgi:hypothetical protein